MNKKARVLVIDDDPDQLLIFSTLLAREGYDTVTAQGGAAGLEALGNGSVDLILCDVCMPVMNGLSFANTVKKNPDYATVPIVLMTAGQNPVNFSESKFKAEGFVLKHLFEKTFLPTMSTLL